MNFDAPPLLARPDLPDWLVLFLYLHIALGFLTIALFGPCAFLTRKGFTPHRVFGRLYFWSMTVLIASGLFVTARTHLLRFRALSALRPADAGKIGPPPPNVIPAAAVPGPGREGDVGRRDSLGKIAAGFLTNFSFNFFGYYMAYSAFRAVRRRLHGAGGGLWPDRAMAFVAVLSVACMIASAVLQASVKWKLDVRMAFFGAWGFWILRRDLPELLRPSSAPDAWFFLHLRNPIGSYGYVVTVFSIAIRLDLPYGIRWLWPSLIALAAILVLSSRYRRTGWPGAASVPGI